MQRTAVPKPMPLPYPGWLVSELLLDVSVSDRVERFFCSPPMCADPPPPPSMPGRGLVLPTLSIGGGAFVVSDAPPMTPREPPWAALPLSRVVVGAAAAPRAATPSPFPSTPGDTFCFELAPAPIVPPRAPAPPQRGVQRLQMAVSSS